jgi:hypothetical protein
MGVALVGLAARTGRWELPLVRFSPLLEANFNSSMVGLLGLRGGWTILRIRRIGLGVL